MWEKENKRSRIKREGSVYREEGSVKEVDWKSEDAVYESVEVERNG